jgi:superoxide reductase
MFKKNKEPIFFSSNHCEHIAQIIRGGSKDTTLSCCNEPMSKLIAKDSEQLREKHLPVIKKDNNKIIVAVGSIYHPMEEKHSIGFVYLQTKRGGQRVDLSHTDEPVVEFLIAEGDEAIAAYAFCNLHGFWMSKVD